MNSKTYIRFLSLMLVVVVSISTAIANEGNCLLKIVAANDLAKTASVYVNDKLEGTLESGELTIFDLDIGTHIITLDGELIEKHELEVVFQSAYESKRIDLEANPGKRAVRIISEPSNAAIRIDYKWLEQTTPWQITLEVGRTYEIELFKEFHGSKTQSLLVPKKGEIIFLNVEIPKADPPKKPLLLYPEDKSIHLEERAVELAWESLDDSLQYEIEFDGKVHTTSNNIARFYSLERGKTYFWRVTAVNRYGMKTTSEQYSFTTQPNRLPEITSVYPQNESSDVFADVITLTWEVTDADGDRVTYDVYFGDALDSLEKVRSKTNSNEHITQELERGKSYYWKIVLTDSYGEVNESSVYSFATMPNRPPIEPFNIIPENGMGNLPDFLTLEWDCTDPDNDNLTYTVYLGADKDSMKQMGETNKKKFVLNDLTRGTSYYWEIVVFDSFGAKTEGPLNTFTTKANIPPVIDPSSEVLLKETDRDVFAELEWFCEDPDDKLLLYDVYLGVDREPSLLLVNYEQSTLLKTNLDFDTTYYWQISAKDKYGGISKGPMWEFTTNDPPVYIPSDFVPEMVLVEKGSFTMGDTWGDGASNEKPTHKVTFTYNFYIGKYETTFDEYDAFCNATGRIKPEDEDWGRGTRPVINVTWWDAIDYCNWLSEKEDLPKASDSDGNLLDKDGMITTDPSKVVGYRLPTEAEWEYAARGGNKSKGYKYSGSDNIDDVAWYWDNAGMKAQEVGKKAPNELGLYDMSGNVWEWCSDWYGYYSSSAQTNPYNSTAGSVRVLRGGSWYSNASNVRVAGRDSDTPTYTYGSLGFRITRTVQYEGANETPLGVTLLYPENGSKDIGIKPVLSWRTQGTTGGEFRIYLGTSRSFLPMVVTSTSSSFAYTGELELESTYFWRVQLWEGGNLVSSSPLWQFSTESKPAQVYDSTTMAVYVNGTLNVISMDNTSGIVSVIRNPYQYQGKVSPVTNGDLIYMVDDTGRLVTLRVSGTTIETVSSLNTGTSPETLVLAGGYLWLLDTKSAAVVLRISLDNGGIPIRSESVFRDWTTPVDMFVSEDLSRIYLADALSGIKVLERSGSSYGDVSSRFPVSLNGYARSVVAVQNLVISGESGIDGGLKMIDLSRSVRSNLGAYYIVPKLLVSNNIIYAITDKGVSIIDISSPSQPVILRDIEISQVEEIRISGRLLAVTWIPAHP